MSTSRGQSVIKTLDDVIALAQVISQPNALASLRAEFEAGVEALIEATAEQYAALENV